MTRATDATCWLFNNMILLSGKRTTADDERTTQFYGENLRSLPPFPVNYLMLTHAPPPYQQERR